MVKQRGPYIYLIFLVVNEFIILLMCLLIKAGGVVRICGDLN